MVTSQRLTVAIWILVGLALAGCEQVTASGASPGPESSPNVCSGDLSRLMLKGWRYIDKTEMDTDGQDGSQCVVFYHFDLPRDGRKTVPVGGLVYRTDRNRPVDIHGYPLALPGGFYLGIHKLTPRTEDVLSGSPGPELIIEDKNEYGVTVEASIFNWEEAGNSEESAYKSRGWFVGDGGVKVELDMVTVLVPRLGTRSQLADRKVYRPRPLDKKSYYPKAKVDQKEDTNRLVDPETIDLVSLDMPADPAAAEYPEKLLLEFYASLPLTDSNKLKGWMVTDTLELFSPQNTGLFGCLVSPQLSKVYVQDIDTRQSQGIPLHIENESKPITDTITVTSVCKINGKIMDKPTVLFWKVQWGKNAGQWVLLKPATKP